jgi:uncharacterized iron-regulated membrane protein
VTSEPRAHRKVAQAVLTTTILIMTTCGLIVASTMVWLIWLERRRNSNSPKINWMHAGAEPRDRDVQKSPRI